MWVYILVPVKHLRSECHFFKRNLSTFNSIFFNIHHVCYQTISALQNALMQQPLAHLYFLTVLEQLQTKAHKPNFLVRLASKIDKVRMIYSKFIVYLLVHFIVFYSSVSVTQLQTL